MTERLKPLTVNLAMLAFFALPLFAVLLWLTEYFRGNVTLEVAALADILMVYIVALAPILVGGVVHHVAIFATPSEWPTWLRRGLAIGLSPILVVPVVLAGTELGFILQFGVPVGLSLVAYGLLFRLPEASPTSTAG